LLTRTAAEEEEGTMRHSNVLVFDDNIGTTTSSSAPVYTSADLNSRLGQFDETAIQWVADNVAGTTPTLSIGIDHSADGRNWLPKEGSGTTITGVAIGGTNITSWSSDPGTVPSLGLVRLRVFLGGTTPSCHLKIYITQRDQA
jgi:hypothetical protein